MNSPSIPAHVEHLMSIERTPAQEKELSDALFGKSLSKFGDQYRWFTFVSLSKVREFYDPVNKVGIKEWVGETKSNEVVVIKYNGGLDMGADRSESKARLNMTNLATSQGFDITMTIERINKQLNMEWVLPDFVE